MLVNRSVLAGSRIEIGLPDGDREVDHFDIVVRGEGGSHRTSLHASIGDSIPLGRRSIERHDNHVAQFAANGTRPRGRKLVLRAENGDVFVESVHILRR